MKVLFIEKRKNGRRYGYALDTKSKCKNKNEVYDLVKSITEPESSIEHMIIK